MATVNNTKPKDEFIKIKMNHGFNVDVRSDSEIAEYVAYVNNLKKTDRKSYVELLKSGPDHALYPAVKGEIVEVSRTWYEAYKNHTVPSSIHLDTNAYKRNDGGSFPFNAQEAIDHGHLSTPDTMTRVKIFELA